MFGSPWMVVYEYFIRCWTSSICYRLTHHKFCRCKSLLRILSRILSQLFAFMMIAMISDGGMKGNCEFPQIILLNWYWLDVETLYTYFCIVNHTTGKGEGEKNQWIIAAIIVKHHQLLKLSLFPFKSLSRWRKLHAIAIKYLPTSALDSPLKMSNEIARIAFKKKLKLNLLFFLSILTPKKTRRIRKKLD